MGRVSLGSCRRRATLGGRGRRLAGRSRAVLAGAGPPGASLGLGHWRVPVEMERRVARGNQNSRKVTRKEPDPGNQRARRAACPGGGQAGRARLSECCPGLSISSAATKAATQHPSPFPALSPGAARKAGRRCQRRSTMCPPCAVPVPTCWGLGVGPQPPRLSRPLTQTGPKAWAGFCFLLRTLAVCGGYK